MIPSFRSLSCVRTIPNPFFHTSRTTSSAMNLNLVYKAKCFEGEQRYYAHTSDVVKCKMDLGVYLPPKAIRDKKCCPVLYHLNGLTATHENFMRKSGFHRFAAKLGLCVVCPDTSPRGIDFPKHEILGPGAGFYVDATRDPWAKHFQMYTYVTKELIDLVNCNFPVIEDKKGISGFSMGGYGALVCSLRNPGFYQSVSAFAPVCNPMQRAKGKLVLAELLGNNQEDWKMWDPSMLAEKYSEVPIEILIDQGMSDEFMQEHLLPRNFLQVTENNECINIIYKERKGYDHTHYYLATFVEEHMEYHASLLNASSSQPVTGHVPVGSI